MDLPGGWSCQKPSGAGDHIGRPEFDTEFEYAPFRVRKIKKGQTRKIYLDYYPIVVKFENLPTQQIQTDRMSNWNLTVPEGWGKNETLSK